MNQYQKTVTFRGIKMSEEMAKLARLWDMEPSPFPPLKVPPLREAEHLHWSLKRLPGLPVVRGYFRGLQPIDHNWRLMHIDEPSGKETMWMSITPMELESQSHHRVAAHGRVLIGGLGMGVLAWNVAQKGNVHEVLVVERDPEVVELVEDQAREMGWANWEKIRYLQGVDLLNLAIPNEQFDVALIDIWPTVGDMRLRPDLQRIAKQIAAKEYAAWGMELDFIDWCNEQCIPRERIQGRHWAAYSDSIGVPLIMRSNRRMAQYAVRAAINAALS